VFKIAVTINNFLRHPPIWNLKPHVKTTVVCIAVFAEKDDHLEGKIGTIILATYVRFKLTLSPVKSPIYIFQFLNKVFSTRTIIVSIKLKGVFYVLK